MNEAPLLAFKRARVLYENPYYLDALNYNLENYFWQELEWRMNNEQNIIIEIAGEPGTGKSFSGFVINHRLQKMLGYEGISQDNACFTYTRALDLSQKYTKRWTIQVDEQKREFFGEGAQRELAALQDLEDIVRQSQTNFIFVSPSPRSFHSGLHFILRTWWIDYKNKTNMLLLFDGDDKSLAKPLGYINIKLPSKNDKVFWKFIEWYRKEKEDYIKKAKERSTRAEYFKKLREIAEKLAKDPAISKKASKKKIIAQMYIKYPEIASGLAIAEIERIADMVKLILEERGEENKIRKKKRGPAPEGRQPPSNFISQ